MVNFCLLPCSYLLFTCYNMYLQVLKASRNKRSDTQLQNGTDGKLNSFKQNGSSTSGANGTNNISDDSHINKKQRIQEKITYDDLDASNENDTASNTQLNLSKVLHVIIFVTPALQYDLYRR